MQPNMEYFYFIPAPQYYYPSMMIPEPIQTNFSPSTNFYQEKVGIMQNVKIEENLNESKTEVKPKKQYNKKKIDPDFQCVKEKKKKFQQFQQKEGRNTASNILRTFSKFLSCHKFDSMYQRIQELHQISVDKQIFLKWVESIGINYKNYIKSNYVLKRLQMNSECTKMLLILLRVHFDVEAKLHLITSTKIKKDNILLSLQRIDTLWEEFITTIIKEGEQKQLQ